MPPASPAFRHRAAVLQPDRRPPGGGLGEDPHGMPSNILPYMMQVAVGRLERLEVYGVDYDTIDGSGVRDYIHVMDVAEAHCIALDHLADETGMRAFNLGTGCGVSVLQLLATFEEISGMTIPYQITSRQPGDVDTLIADPSLVEKAWGWRTVGICRLCAATHGTSSACTLTVINHLRALTNRRGKMRISVIGTGYLGAVHAACMAELGHEVLGVDNDAKKIAALAEGRAPFYEPGLSEMLVRTVGSGKLRFSTSLAEAAEFADIHFICVGTPQLPGSLGADLSHIEAVIDGLARICSVTAWSSANRRSRSGRPPGSPPGWTR